MLDIRLLISHNIIDNVYVIRIWYAYTCIEQSSHRLGPIVHLFNSLLVCKLLVQLLSFRYHEGVKPDSADIC